MHPEIEKLIDLALVDGHITDKERNVILNKAAEYGISSDEVEMIWEAKKTLLEKSSVGAQIKCPACGARISGLSKTCTCGFVFNTGTIQETKSLESAIETLENLIIEVRGLSSSTSKEIIEQLIARVEKEIRFIKTRYADNYEIKKLLSELEAISNKYIKKAFKQTKTKKVIKGFTYGFIFLIIIASIINKYTKKNSSEKFTDAVNSRYLEKYKIYTSSEQYRVDLSKFESLFVQSRLSNGFTSQKIQDSLNQLFNEFSLSENISEFYFYSKAADYLRQRDLINAQRYIDTSLVLNPNFGPSYFKLHQIVENKDSSIKFISKAISLDKKNGFVYFPYRSWLYYDKNDFPNALRDINIYLESYPKSMPLDLERFLWKLAVLLDAGNTGEAIQEFDTLSTAQIEQIKFKGNDSYNMIIEKCKRK